MPRGKCLALSRFGLRLRFGAAGSSFFSRCRRLRDFLQKKVLKSSTTMLVP